MTQQKYLDTSDTHFPDVEAFLDEMQRQVCVMDNQYPKDNRLYAVYDCLAEVISPRDS